MADEPQSDFRDEGYYAWLYDEQQAGGPGRGIEPQFICEHGVTADCEQCIEQQSIADDQATDEDWTDDDA
jgi:hypothetical protein